MKNLRSDFSRFFEALHGTPPFPWQARLAERVCTEGTWPPCLNLPTASGKTACLDVAIFHLACTADRSPADRAPRRVFLVVDRRLVVDNAFERAERIRQGLDRAQGGILKDLADRLRSLGGKTPLETLRLRGGLPQEEMGDLDPLQPVAGVSTVDQVGSRLLFRGYGVSPYARPLHAALLAWDTLILLDEAHLSAPFLETARRVRTYLLPPWTPGSRLFPSPLQVIPLSATLRDPADEGFHLDAEDRSNPLLAGRIGVSKPIVLLDLGRALPSYSEARWNGLVAEEASKHMERLTEAGMSSPVVGVVLNRVASARGVQRLLSSLRDKEGNLRDVLLLTGRNRPVDRERLLEAFLPRMRAGREPQDNPRPLFVVATQTVEVGADLDFDALVTELAPLDALRQRFGRLDRLGRLGLAEGTLLYHPDRHRADDPVYRDALPPCWTWLRKAATREGKGARSRLRVDFGIRALENLLEETPPPEKSVSLPSQAPLLMPSHVDLLAQTHPVPGADPSVSTFLHGPGSEQPEVQVVWRADLPAEPGQNHEGSAGASLFALPPLPGEGLSLPLAAVQRWLAKQPSGGSDFGDLEGTPAETPKKPASPPRRVFRWRGDTCDLAESKDLAPGDFLVAPATYGGLDPFGWDPDSSAPVSDAAEIALWGRGREDAPLRLHPALWASWFPHAPLSEELRGQLRALAEGEDPTPEEFLETLRQNLVEILSGEPEKPLPERDEAFRIACRNRLERIPPSCRFLPTPDGEGILLLPPRGRPLDPAFASPPIPLHSHAEGVRAAVETLCTVLGIPSPLADDLAFAAFHHDLGKLDPRFQAWLRDDAFLEREEPLAKSGRSVQDQAALRASRRRAGLPGGYRHEETSAGLLQSSPQLLGGARDPDLTVYLVGTHHGRGRPTFPLIFDEGVEQETTWAGAPLSLRAPCSLGRLGSGWTDRFWRLNRRYGWWGLALLETLLRQGDRTRSEEESRS